MVEGRHKQSLLANLAVSLLAFLLTVIALYQVFFSSRLPFGTRVGSFNLGGLKFDAAVEYLGEELGPDLVINFTNGSQVIESAIKDIGITFDARKTIESAFAFSGGDIKPIYDIDQEKFQATLEKIEFELSQKPQDAVIGYSEQQSQFESVEAVFGKKILIEDFESFFTPDLATLYEIIPVPFELIEPNIRTDEALEAVKLANNWLSAEVEVEIEGEQKVIAKDKIKSSIIFVATDVMAAEINDQELANNLNDIAEGINLGGKVLDKAKLAKDLAVSIKDKQQKVIAQTYTPAPVTQTVSSTSSATASSSVSSGNYITPSGNYDPGGPGRKIGYSIRVEDGLPVDANGFANEVASILDNDLSWRGSGKLHFARYESGGFALYLVSPATVDRLCYPLNTNGFTSCRVGSRVVINSDRWQYSSPYFTGSLGQYRQYLINHEVGHMIGNGHHPCPGSGVAPVMHQQTLGMGGCEPGPWPLDWELAGVN